MYNYRSYPDIYTPSTHNIDGSFTYSMLISGSDTKLQINTKKMYELLSHSELGTICIDWIVDYGLTITKRLRKHLNA